MLPYKFCRQGDTLVQRKGKSYKGIASRKGFTDLENMPDIAKRGRGWRQVSDRILCNFYSLAILSFGWHSFSRKVGFACLKRRTRKVPRTMVVASEARVSRSPRPTKLEEEVGFHDLHTASP
jgi:hypothetical protein